MMFRHYSGLYLCALVVLLSAAFASTINSANSSIPAQSWPGSNDSAILDQTIGQVANLTINRTNSTAGNQVEYSEVPVGGGQKVETEGEDQEVHKVGSSKPADSLKEETFYGFEESGKSVESVRKNTPKKTPLSSWVVDSKGAETIARERALAAQDYVPGELIVKFRGVEPKGDMLQVAGADSLNKLNSKHGVNSIKRALKTRDKDLSRIYRLSVDKDKDIIKLAEEYSANPAVEFAEPNYIRTISLEPNDPRFADSTQWALKKINSTYAWNITRGSSSVVIAIIDTGVDWNHPDLAAHIWNNSDEIPGNSIDDDANGFIDDVRGWDFVNTTYNCIDADCDTRDNDPMDFHGHGTHCSGIAAAVTNNAVGIAGLCWNCTIMAVRAGYKATTGGSLEDADVADAIIYATDNGADVISMSFSGPSPSNIVSDSLRYAHSRGVILVAAAGNENHIDRGYPAAEEAVIAVSATTTSDDKASFSNYGSWIDVGAPGVSIHSTIYDNTYASWQGTSMATPHVAGLAGLLLSKNHSLAELEVRSLIRSTVDPATSSSYIGIGRLNAYKALSRNSIIVTNINFSNSSGNLDDYYVIDNMPVYGSVRGSGFQNYTMYAGFGNYPTTWFAINFSTTEKAYGTVARFSQNKLRAPMLYSLGTSTHNCSVWDSVDSIISVLAPDIAEPGDSFNLTVNWTGRHWGDENHWGVFLNDMYIGSCRDYMSDVASLRLLALDGSGAASEDRWRGGIMNASFSLSCNITLSGSLPLGSYNLTVTGNDVGGYCEPGETGTDAELSVPIWIVNKSQCYTIYGGGRCEAPGNCSCINDALDNPICRLVELNESVVNTSGTCIDGSGFSHKTLDCLGHSIDGDDAGADFGIDMSDGSGGAVRNCVLSGFGTGIFLDSEDNRIVNNTIINNSLGVRLAGRRNNLSSNTVCGNGNDINNTGANSGDNNTCDLVYNWTDSSSAVGCTHTCRSISVSLTKTANITTATIGDRFAFNITIENNGAPVYNLFLADSLNTSCIRLVSASPANDTPGPGWSLGNISISSNRTVTIVVDVTSSGHCDLNNTVYLNGSNLATINASVYVNITDTTPPELWWSWVDINSTTSLNSTTIGVNASEKVNCTLNLNGTWYANATVSDSVAWRIADRTDGNHSVYVLCEDRYGNKANTAVAWWAVNSDSVDLSVSEGDIALSDNTPKEGSLLRITANVSNFGSRDSGNFLAAFLLDGVRLDTNTLSVRGRSSNTTSFSWAAEVGSHNITIVADYDGEVNETVENNNNATREITVEAADDDGGGGGRGGGGGGGGGHRGGGGGGAIANILGITGTSELKKLEGNGSETVDIEEPKEGVLDILVFGDIRNGREFVVVVVDADGNPLEGAAVSYGDERKLTTADGKAVLIAKNGITEISAEMAGFKPFSKNIEVAPNSAVPAAQNHEPAYISRNMGTSPNLMLVTVLASIVLAIGGLAIYLARS